ncbi:MAG: radical SAM protein [Candidatus Omnitrophica bacterium]|nr:radical SAM protein [Candidatus Omnitrophota bacterium]
MNFILTTSCNKGCPYCFAHQNRKDDPNNFMSLKSFEEMVDKTNSQIKLLGGEPTQHPQFKEIIEILIRKKRRVTLISNFLFDDETLNIILEALEHIEIHFLVNATDLDKKNRMEKWSKNYNTIFKFLYAKDKEEYMSIGITLYDQSLKYYLNYIDFLKKNILKIERFRLSIAFPGSKEEKNNFYIINNKELGKTIVSLVYKIVDMGIKPSIDCILFPCMFNNKEEYKYIRKFSQEFRFKCNAAPCDLFPDKTISYCYPLKEKIKINFDNYLKSKPIQEDLRLRYKILEEQIEKPVACKSCEYFKKNLCDGPCLGFYDLESLETGVKL